jgi:bile acid:Na+ symporter, BASS family
MARKGFALSIFMGLALPQFAAAARPLLPITIFLFVAMTFARADLCGPEGRADREARRRDHRRGVADRSRPSR